VPLNSPRLTTTCTGAAEAQFSRLFIVPLGGPVMSSVALRGVKMDPTTIPGTVFWGVVAGVMTAHLIFLFGLLLSEVVRPWYQDLVYKGVDLRGRWVQEYESNGATYNFETLLEQNAHDLKGTTTITRFVGGKHDYVQTFDVVGMTWEGFVMLNLRSKERKSLSFATGLFKVKERGKRLVGHLAYRASATDEVESEKGNWERLG
jgi:hypothetical protein